jgi:flagellar M-ring protein FliF
MAGATNLPLAHVAAGVQRLPMQNRIGLLVALAALVAMVVGFVMWGTQPEYRVLFSNVPDRDGGAIVQALSQMNVPYKMSDSGTAILVPAAQVHDVRLRLASQGLPRGGTVGFELMENQKFGTTQFQEQVNYQRALEGELARSIQSLAAVQSARVHLAIPKPSVFLRDNQKPTASVLVNLNAGRSLDRAQVTGIQHLVASSVPELALTSVSVVDQTGTLLSARGDGRPGTQLDADQLAYVNQIESSYARRIQDILEPIVGRANVRAQVTADLDFSEQEATAEIYKPNQDPKAATIRSQQTMDQKSTTPGGAGGVPGALTNQPAPAATAPITGANPNAGGAGAAGAAQSAVSTHKESTTNYEVDKTVRHTRMPVGAIKRLSAAVVVNYRRELIDAPVDPKAAKAKADVKAAKPKLVALKPEEIEQITALAKEAIGFSQQRGDSLNVANAPFTAEDAEPLAEPPLWKQPENVALAKDLGRNLGIAAFVLLIVFGVLRPLMRALSAPAQPAVAVEGELLEGPQAGGSPSGYTASLEAAKQLARQDPKVVANVVRNWVSGSSANG